MVGGDVVRCSVFPVHPQFGPSNTTMSLFVAPVCGQDVSVLKDDACGKTELKVVQFVDTGFHLLTALVKRTGIVEDLFCDHLPGGFAETYQSHLDCLTSVSLIVKYQQAIPSQGNGGHRLGLDSGCVNRSPGGAAFF